MNLLKARTGTIFALPLSIARTKSGFHAIERFRFRSDYPFSFSCCKTYTVFASILWNFTPWVIFDVKSFINFRIHWHDLECFSRSFIRVCSSSSTETFEYSRRIFGSIFLTLQVAWGLFEVSPVLLSQPVFRLLSWCIIWLPHSSLFVYYLINEKIHTFDNIGCCNSKNNLIWAPIFWSGCIEVRIFFRNRFLVIFVDKIA